MAIRKKIDKRIISEVIEKGGSVSTDKDNKKNERINFCLSMQISFLEEVKEAVKQRMGMSTTAWILEAIQEKLKRIDNV